MLDVDEDAAVRLLAIGIPRTTAFILDGSRRDLHDPLRRCSPAEHAPKRAQGPLAGRFLAEPVQVRATPSLIRARHHVPSCETLPIDGVTREIRPLLLATCVEQRETGSLRGARDPRELLEAATFLHVLTSLVAFLDSIVSQPNGNMSLPSRAIITDSNRLNDNFVH
jgi:hypothetical protein